jgi:hypothetical protein
VIAVQIAVTAIATFFAMTEEQRSVAIFWWSGCVMPKLKHWGTIWVEPLVLAHVVMLAVGYPQS